MVLTIAISLLFGFAAFLAIVICARQARQAVAAWKSVSVELAIMDRAGHARQCQPRPWKAAHAAA